MATKKKMLQAAAGSATGGAGLDVNEVFSTYLYTGNGSTQTITNGIDLAGEGGLVWIKHRDSATQHRLFDTERGANISLTTSDTSANDTLSGALTSFNSDGFTLGSHGNVNANNYDLASWTFRKAPKFFDVVTYTGTGVARTISHNLGSVPGCIIVKRTDTGGINWTVYHREMDANPTQPARYFLELNQTGARTFDESAFGTLPTDSVFTVGTDNSTNASGGTYVAYLFAHNDGDGEFGADGDADIIKCGSFTTNSDGSLDLVDLGFEPQWLLIKNSSTTGNWEIHDVMRDGTLSTRLRANLADAEVSYSSQFLKAEATGFSAIAGWGGASNTKIYMAIRRGPLAQPESGTDVFAVNTGTGTIPTYLAGFTVDMSLNKQASAVVDMRTGTRLTGTDRLVTNSTAAAASDNAFVYDYMDGWSESYANSTHYSWMWKRAPGFFDVVAGNLVTSSANSSDPHSLGVTPEMMITKERTITGNWFVWHKDLPIGGDGRKQVMMLNATNAAFDQSTASPINPFAGPPSETSFVHRVNAGSAQIAYLFATVPGVSKVGSYTGDGTTDGSKVINCGFSSGSRFVLIKCASAVNDWYVFDTQRGIVAGNDPALQLNTTSAEITGSDLIDPDSSGFIVGTSFTSMLTFNQSNETYIFYAIA